MYGQGEGAIPAIALFTDVASHPGGHCSVQDRAFFDSDGSKYMKSALISDRELRLTAVVYARLGVVPYLRTHGRLPDRIGGPWNLIPMRLVIEERGTDPELTDDERLVYEAILREGRLPGGSVVLLDEEEKRRKLEKKQLRARKKP